MKGFKYLLVIAVTVLAGTPAWAEVHIDPLKFTLHKMESDKPGPTLLVIGGIQGDEPGGFNAASLLVTNYEIHQGHVWVVPNLNFASIIKRSRGIYGDMNRKFAHIPPSDPEYHDVQAIKSIILDKQVDVILNLHDGSGFYRKQYFDRLHNPHRWGQTIIIDQQELPGIRFGKLEEIAQSVVNKVNRSIKNTANHYAVKNTLTNQGNEEMEKTLTYFAIRNNRPAFGIEASKTFLTHDRTRFHLRVVEGFMQQLGIEYQRTFTLDSQSVKNSIDNNVKLALYENRMFFDMGQARPRLAFVPMKKNSPLRFSTSNPLVAIVGKNNSYHVRYGNRSVTRLHPQYFEFDDSLKSADFEVDGETKNVEFGSVVEVSDEFKVLPISGYRVNVIGFTKRGILNEGGITISKHEILDRFSIDKSARLYRVEFYKKDKFCGMVLVNFTNQPQA